MNLDPDDSVDTQTREIDRIVDESEFPAPIEEEKKYGLNKPVRIVINAKISHD